MTTGAATDVGPAGATSNGDLDDLGGAHDAEVYFEWGEHDAPLSNATPRRTVTKVGAFSAEVDGLLREMGYDSRAVVEAGDGQTDAGTVRSFLTGLRSTGLPRPPGALSPLRGRPARLPIRGRRPCRQLTRRGRTRTTANRSETARKNISRL